jgi:hypothetical protein
MTWSFFELVFAIAIFLPVFATVFFNRNHKLFLHLFFLQSNCYKVAITLAIRLQSFTRDKVAIMHMLVLANSFFAISTSVVATTL